MMQEIYAQKVFGCVLCFFLFAAVASAQVATSTQENKKDIMVGSSLTKGFDMGVDSSEHVKKWVKKLPEYMEVAFPAYQESAAVFITVGKPVDLPRNKWMDLSAYKTLSIEMRGEKGGETVEIGIKSNIQEDDGTETKVTVRLIPEWKTYSFPLDEFKGADLSHLYVVTEFVYNDKAPQTMHFRNIKFIK
jgi:hypothetical protein